MSRTSHNTMAARGARSKRIEARQATTQRDQRGRWKIAGLVLALASLLYIKPLTELAGLAVHRELYSHLLILPLLVATLVWMRRAELVEIAPVPGKSWATVFFAGSALLLWGSFRSGSSELEDRLAWIIGSYVLLLWGIAMITQGWNRCRVILGPLLLLVFLVPLPVGFEQAVTRFLQTGSAGTAWILFQAMGTPVLYNDAVFQLPGFQMMVAPECSGIHSTLSLLIVSLLAGQMLLRSNWRKAALVAMVLPLALLRNGLRVVTISELCIRKGPEMIDSIYHRQGGPIFFAISLVPFAALLIFLARRDRLTKSNPIAA